MATVAIIIPTTGAPLVRPCIESALRQTHPGVKVVIVVDGPEFADAFRASTAGLDLSGCQLCVLPANVGRNGFYGHRVYAAFSHLVDADFICYLDQDNWLEPEHVATLVESVEQHGWDWAYSLRKVMSNDGRFLMHDESQSVGPWGKTGTHQLVDTNCYCLRAAVAHRVASAWHGGWGQDRVFYASVSSAFPNFGTSGRYTLNYRTRDDMQAKVLALLERENAAMHQRHPAGLPWVRSAEFA